MYLLGIGFLKEVSPKWSRYNKQWWIIEKRKRKKEREKWSRYSFGLPMWVAIDYEDPCAN